MHSFRLLNEIYLSPCLSGYFSEALWLYIQPQFLKNVLKMTGGCASTKGGVKLLSLPIKVYARVLERRVRALVELRIQEKQYGFHPGCRTLDQFFTLSGILEDAWEFVQTVYMCFVDLEKTFDHVPRGVLWDVPREYAAAMMWVLHWSIAVKRELS